MNDRYEEILNIFLESHDAANERGINLKLPDYLGRRQINPRISNRSCRFHCENPWKEVYIRYNGDLTSCNMLNPYIYGNCLNYPFEKIWCGLNANLFRTFVNTEFRHYYCRECYYLV